MSQTIQERFENGEKLNQKEMIEVVRWRTIYGMTILGIVRDVGETYRVLNYEKGLRNYRAHGHIGHFNNWWRWVKADRPPAAEGKKNPGKLGYYDFLVDFLTKRGRTKWTRKNSPEIVFKTIESGEMNGHQSGELEDKWIKHHKATTLNVVPGGNKSGKKRKYGGIAKTFGHVGYHIKTKVFKAQWSPEGGKQKYIPGSSSTNIKYTYKCLIQKYTEVKDQECYNGCEPKSLENYMEHLGSKYGLTMNK